MGTMKGIARERNDEESGTNNGKYRGRSKECNWNNNDNNNNNNNNNNKNSNNKKTTTTIQDGDA